MINDTPLLKVCTDGKVAVFCDVWQYACSPSASQPKVCHFKSSCVNKSHTEEHIVLNKANTHQKAIDERLTQHSDAEHSSNRDKALRTSCLEYQYEHSTVAPFVS